MNRDNPPCHRRQSDSRHDPSHPARAMEATATKIPRAGAGMKEKPGRQESDREGRDDGAMGEARGELDHDHVSPWGVG